MRRPRRRGSSPSSAAVPLSGRRSGSWTGLHQGQACSTSRGAIRCSSPSQPPLNPTSAESPTSHVSLHTNNQTLYGPSLPATGLTSLRQKLAFILYITEFGSQLNSHHIHRLVSFLVCLRRRLVVQMFGCCCIYMYFLEKKIECPSPLCCMTQPFCTCNVVILPQKEQFFFANLISFSLPCCAVAFRCIYSGRNASTR